MTYQVSHFINGKKTSTSGKMLEIYNPATGEVAGQVVCADKKIVDDAIAAAKKCISRLGSL